MKVELQDKLVILNLRLSIGSHRDDRNRQMEEKQYLARIFQHHYFFGILIYYPLGRIQYRLCHLL